MNQRKRRAAARNCSHILKYAETQDTDSDIDNDESLLEKHTGIITAVVSREFPVPLKEEATVEDFLKCILA